MARAGADFVWYQQAKLAGKNRTDLTITEAV